MNTTLPGVIRCIDATVIEGDARYTLIWKQQDSQWLIIHEHLSSTVN
ncbi:MAG: hypothetical protein ACRC11_17645 [Xenococcaceae cyanobacterium]